MVKLLPKIELLLIGIWLGAAVFFSAGVAPGAFAVLPSRELAGSMVNRSLMIVNLSGLIISILLLLATLIPRGEEKKVWIWLQRVFLVIVAAACAVGHFVIAFWLAYLRIQMNRPIDELPATDPLRIQFNNLHQYSVWVLITAMAAALIVFFVISRRPSQAASSSGASPGFELPDDLKF